MVFYEYVSYMMKKLLSIFFLFILFNGQSQTDFKGVWQGIIILDGQKSEQGNLIYANFTITGNKVEGKTREEYYGTEFYAVKKINGTVTKNQIQFKQTMIEKKKSSPKITWCLLNATLTYVDSCGYLEGRYTSSDCRKGSGKMIFYRSSVPFSDTEKEMLSQGWLESFKGNLKKGLCAPPIEDSIRKNFVFEPIFFDVDSSVIKSEYYKYLLKMIRVINGHTDLRIQVTGHTDSDGSDEYNLALSQRRSQAIIDFFNKNGISTDRLSIDFKGEKNPIDSNNTIEGKKLNRRVEFEFVYK